MKLHLGCGKRNFGSEWIHIDQGDYPYLHSNNIEQLPFENDSIDLIYASHVIEYFDREEIGSILLEWWRVLKRGGILRLAVPDFCKIAKLYRDEGTQLRLFLGPLYGRMLVDDKYIYHKTTYDYDGLQEVLGNAKFRNVREWDWRETEHSQFDDHSQAHLPHMIKDTGTLISLNVEAEK